MADPDDTPDLALQEIQGLPGQGMAPAFGPDRRQRRNDHSEHETCREGDHRPYGDVTCHHSLLRPPAVFPPDRYLETRCVRTWYTVSPRCDHREVRLRVVRTALRMVLEPIFEWEFAEHSYGFRPKRGCKDALRRVDELLKTGYTYIVDADLKSYFDTIPHDRLMALVGRKVSDGRVLNLIEAFLKQGVLDGLREWTPEMGSPQGAVVSPLLSNIYLNPLDHKMAQEGFEMVRYADDFVILCRSPEDATRALAVVQEWTAEAGLMLHPTKTRIVNATTDSFEFLGYRFSKGKRFPRTKSLQKLKDTIRAKTKRTNGQCLPAIIGSLNPTLRGWFEYFKHSYKTTFPELDGWIRGRLRSILRKRQKKRGRGRGSDHQRWPNAYFADLGLYSLKAAHGLACQSSLR
ncbi:MAG: group II intron reverse transcriptase/maturase [Isosphaeraceae bacterium]